MSKPHLTVIPPQASGSPWEPNGEELATVPVPLSVIIVNVEGPFTEQDRKLWTFLLHHAFNELGETEHHVVSVKAVAKIFRDMGGRHEKNWIWESTKRLAKTTVEYRFTHGDKRYTGITSLFSAELEESLSGQKDILHYSFPSKLVPILRDPKRFARLRTHVMMSLSGKYTVTLYELLESVANMRNPKLSTTVAELRQWLKIPEGKLKRWPDFRRYALAPSVKEINDNKDGTGFTVKMTTEKEGRAITRVHFYVTKTQQREILEGEILSAQGNPPVQKTLFENIPLKPSTFEIAKKHTPGWDVYELENQWRAWAQGKGDWPPRNPDGAFINFCKQKGSHLRTV
jgi:Initiator Replication protein